MSALPTQGTPAPEAAASPLPETKAREAAELPPAASLTSIVVRRRKPAAETRPAETPTPETPATETPDTEPPATETPAAAPAAERPAAPPAPAPQAPAAAPSDSARSEAGPRPAEALLQHWDELRHGRARPRIAELDDVAIAGGWPNSFLLRVSGSPERPRLEPARTFGGNGSNGTHVDATAIDWMVALGREVARDGRPLHEVDELPTPAGDKEHGVVALPFGDPAGAVDHVLCHIYRRAAPPPPRRQRPGQLFGRR